MEDTTSDNSLPSLRLKSGKGLREEGTPPAQVSSMGTFHKGIVSLITILALFFKQAPVGNTSSTVTDYSSILIPIFVVALVVHFGSLASTKKIQADPDKADLGKLVNTMSIVFGILALAIELLIIVPAIGLFALFFCGSICLVCIVIKSYQYSKDKLIAMYLWLKESRAVSAPVRACYKLKAMIRIGGRGTEHEAQDHESHINELIPV